MATLSQFAGRLLGSLLQPVVIVGSDGSTIADPGSPLPLGATPITATSGVVAAAAAVATLPGVAGKTTYISGFQCMGLGATAGSTVQVAVTGLISGTQTYLVTVPAGATLAASPYPLSVAFDPPLPASAVNTAIVVTMPSLGAGNTAAVANAQGFQL